jgi:hypothetical protein
VSEHLTKYFDDLDRQARAANAAEDEFRNNISKRMRELEEERAFAFRRLNLVKAIGAAVLGAKDEDEAKEQGASAFLTEVSWTGGSQSQRDVVARFEPVALALWAASKPEATAQDTANVSKELAAFEEWFGQNREAAFLTLMQQELPELPLVEVS